MLFFLFWYGFTLWARSIITSSISSSSLNISRSLFSHSSHWRLSFFFSYSTYSYVVSTRPVLRLRYVVLHFWQTIIDIITADSVHFIHDIITADSNFFSTSGTFSSRSICVNSMLYFRSFTSCLKCEITIFPDPLKIAKVTPVFKTDDFKEISSKNVKLPLMIFVMFTSCFLNSSLNASLISFVIFSSSREIFGHIAILKEFERLIDV